MIWSSAMPRNVQGMCQTLLTKEQQNKLIACWARDTLRLSPTNYMSKVQVYKQLEWIWNDEGVRATNPHYNQTWDQTNTVLIDDSKDKAASEPHNLIEIEEFEAREDQMKSDVLGHVVWYLEELRKHANVSAFMRQFPFRYIDGFEFDWDTLMWKK